MMKAFKFYKTSCFMLLGLMLGCSDAKEDDDVFDTPIEQRLSEQLKFYLNALQSSPEGWRLDYQPNPDASVSHFHLTFNEDLSAEIVSDIGGGVFDLPTTYRVSRTHIPELVIESYSAFHFLFEENGFSNNAEFQFNFVSVQDDEIVLVSKTDSENDEQTVLTLTRATTSDKQAVLSFRENLGALGDQLSPPNCFRNIEIKDADNVLLGGSFEGDSELQTAEICYLDNLGEQNTIQLSFIPTEQGLEAVEPIEIGGQEIRNFIFNPDENTLTSTDGGLQTTIAYSNTANPNRCSLLLTIFYEPFSTEIPDGWDIVNSSFPVGSTTFRWTSDFQGTATSTFNAASGGAGSQVSNWLISPELNLRNGDFIGFWYIAGTQTAFADRMEVRISTNGENTVLPELNSSQDVGDFQMVLLDINPNEQLNTFPNTWTYIRAEISNLPSSPVMSRIAFRHRITDASVNGNQIWVDQISHYSPVCQ